MEIPVRIAQTLHDARSTGIPQRTLSVRFHPLGPTPVPFGGTRPVVEEFRDSVKPNAKHYSFSFYNGLLISDPKGRGSLRLTASEMPDFVITGEFTFGPEAA